MNVLLKPYLAIIFFISTVLFLEFRALSSPVINEFLALNKSTIYDEDGQSSDWIEIFNPNQSAVNLEGYYLTNDSNNLEKWRFPNVSIAEGEYLIVFASGKDGIFDAGTPIGKTTNDGEVNLFVDPNQLSFVTVNLIKPSKEIF